MGVGIPSLKAMRVITSIFYYCLESLNSATEFTLESHFRKNGF